MTTEILLPTSATEPSAVITSNVLPPVLASKLTNISFTETSPFPKSTTSQETTIVSKIVTTVSTELPMKSTLESSSSRGAYPEITHSTTFHTSYTIKEKTTAVDEKNLITKYPLNTTKFKAIVTSKSPGTVTSSLAHVIVDMTTQPPFYTVQTESDYTITELSNIHVFVSNYTNQNSSQSGLHDRTDTAKLSNSNIIIVVLVIIVVLGSTLDVLVTAVQRKQTAAESRQMTYIFG